MSEILINVVVVEEVKIAVVNEATFTHSLAIAEQGPMGPRGFPGGAGSGSALEYPFSWGDVAIGFITTALLGKTIFKVEVIIKTAFNVASTISVGDVNDHDRLVNGLTVDSTQVGTYQSNPGYNYPANTDINLYLTAGGGVSSGNGLILIYMQG